jgi:copper chaperone NosL
MRSLLLHARRVGLLALAGVLLAACTVRPEPVHLGSDECAHCRMTISDARFASQALTRTGLAHKFDAIECLAAFIQGENAPAEGALHSLWVTDFVETERWIPAEEARYVHGEGVRSPMSGGLAAHADAESARRHAESVSARLIGWEEVLTLTREGGHAHRH